ncbi:hypothetical protein ACGF0D_42750 [Kitasatospora sp. NPDC048298]|uniref:hypothetical protein n=1 Tax=Kitasatospora sp. NPDC048298 TaxID=3364049 RepID=UPI003717DB3A
MTTPTPAARHRNERPDRPDRSIVTLVQDLPDLADVAEGTGELTPMERANLAAAESAIDTFQASGWAAGQALAVIAKGHLHRDTHPTFPEYLADRWGMKSSPAYRLMEGWRLAARLAPETAGRGVTGSHVTSLMPVLRQHSTDKDDTDKRGETIAAAVFHGAQEALLESTGNRKLTAALLDTAVAALPDPGDLPDDLVDREKAVRELAREAVASRIGDGGAGGGGGEPKATTKASPLRLAVPQGLAVELDDWTSQLSAGLGMTLSRDAVVARIVELALEEPDALVAVAQRIESESAEQIGTARRWTWTPAGTPRGYIRIAEHKPKGHKAGRGEPEIGCSEPGAGPCEEILVWRVTNHPVGKTAQPGTAYWCEEHLPADCSPPGRWAG